MDNSVHNHFNPAFDIREIRARRQSRANECRALINEGHIIHIPNAQDNLDPQYLGLISRIVCGIDEHQREGLLNQIISNRSGPIPLALGRLVPYESGYGDFCLIRTDPGSLIPSPKVVSNTEPFPLMRLPRELRNMVYKAALSPLCDDGMFQFKITDPALNECITCKGGCPVHKRKATYWTEHPRHPGRTSHYDFYPIYTKLLTSVGNRTCQGFGSIEAHAAEDLRNLSNTNSIVRKELAEATWAKTKIVFPTFNIALLENFLLDRPAIWTGLKALTLEMNFLNGNHQLESLPRRYTEICERIAKLVKFETLEVKIAMYESDLLEVYSEVGPESRFGNVLAGIQSLNVTREFDLDLVPRPDPGDDDAVFAERCDELHDLVKPGLMTWILPYSLIKEEKTLDDMTEVEKYMANRVGTPGKPVKQFYDQ